MPRGRLALLVGGGIGLAVGLWTGLARAGVHEPIGPVAQHGIIMVLGFLGTLIALERAVALGQRWGYGGPFLSAVSVLWLLGGLPDVGAGLLLTVGGALVTAVYAVTLRRHPEAHLVVMAAGAVAWVLSAALWTAGWSPVRLAPTLAAFLVLTIVGERLELSRLRAPSPAVRRQLLAATGVFALGATAALLARQAGLLVMGVGLLAQTAWLVRHDVARITIHVPGLPRFAAACLLSGYAWLAGSGLLWIAVAMNLGAWLVHDAALHALFLGFVMSMVMGHAPIILPAVLGVQLPHRAAAWVPLALLHTSVLLRVAADLGGSTWLRGWAAHGNVAALVVFVTLTSVTAGSVSRAGRYPRPPSSRRVSADRR